MMTTVFRAPSDREVAFALLHLLRDRSQEEVEEMVEGVTQSDVSRWSRGVFQRMHARKRRAVLRFLAERGVPEDEVGDVATRYRAAVGVVHESRAPYGSNDAPPTPRADELLRVLSHDAVRERLGGNGELARLARELSRDYGDVERARVERWIVELGAGRG